MAEVRTEINPHLKSAVTVEAKSRGQSELPFWQKGRTTPKADVTFLSKALCFKDIPLPNTEKEKK